MMFAYLSFSDFANVLTTFLCNHPSSSKEEKAGKKLFREIVLAEICDLVKLTHLAKTCVLKVSVG